MQMLFTDWKIQERITMIVSKSEKLGSYRARGFPSFTSNFAAK